MPTWSASPVRILQAWLKVPAVPTASRADSPPVAVQVSISGQALVFVVRTESWSFMSRAGNLTYVAFFVAQVPPPALSISRLCIGARPLTLVCSTLSFAGVQCAMARGSVQT